MYGQVCKIFVSLAAFRCVRTDSTFELCPDFAVYFITWSNACLMFYCFFSWHQFCLFCVQVIDDLLDSLAMISPDRKILTSEGPTIVISEMMIVNDDESVVDEDGETADWIELFNASDEDVDLEVGCSSPNSGSSTPFFFRLISVRRANFKHVAGVSEIRCFKSKIVFPQLILRFCVFACRDSWNSTLIVSIETLALLLRVGTCQMMPMRLISGHFQHW